MEQAEFSKKISEMCKLRKQGVPSILRFWAVTGKILKELDKSHFDRPYLRY